MAPKSGPGPHPTATVEKVREALLNADTPILSRIELAEEVGVSKEALRKRHEDFLADEAINAKQVDRTWAFWHGAVETKQAWASGIGPDESDKPVLTTQIGVEHIDELDISGEGDELKKRRGAINVVFKHLFLSDHATERELRHLVSEYPFAGLADRDALWSEGIEVALNESEYFERDGNEWVLSPTGRELKEERGSRPLWSGERQANLDGLL